MPDNSSESMVEAWISRITKEVAKLLSSNRTKRATIKEEFAQFVMTTGHILTWL